MCVCVCVCVRACFYQSQHAMLEIERAHTTRDTPLSPPKLHSSEELEIIKIIFLYYTGICWSQILYLKNVENSKNEEKPLNE